MKTSDWISLLGVVTSGIFSFMLWKATRASTKLSKAIWDSQKSEKEEIHQKYVGRVRNDLVRIVNVVGSVARSDVGFPEDWIRSFLKDVLNTNFDIGVEEETIRDYFPKVEVNAIDSMRMLFNIFKQKIENEYTDELPSSDLKEFLDFAKITWEYMQKILHVFEYTVSPSTTDSRYG